MQNSIGKIKTLPIKYKYLWIWAALFTLLIYFLPYIILGENSTLRVFDNMDGENLYKIFTARKGFWLNYDAVIPEIMNGLPRFCIISGLNFTTLMFGIFPPFIAYMVNDFIMRFIGFIGIYLLMNNYILTNSQKEIQSILIAIGYVMISYFTIYGLTDLGQPLVLFAFLNILNSRQKWYDSLCILLFPFFVSFVLSGFFVGVALGIIWLVECIRKRRFLSRSFFILIAYAICCLIVEYNLIIPVLSDFHSHREEALFSKSDQNFIVVAAKELWETYIHPGQFFTLPIWVLVGCALIVGKNNRKKILGIVSLFLLIYLTIIGIGYFNFSAKGFRFSRFYHLLPLCWFILGAMMIDVLSPKYNKIVYMVLLLQIAFLGLRHFNYSTGNKIRIAMGFPPAYNYPSYKSFYAEKLFRRVADYIGRPQKDYRVANIGILPAVAQYNGFYTLDSYQNNYPLSYKHEFGRIIEKEINKKKNNSSFPHFGNWCYIFPSEINESTIIEGKYHKGGELHDLELIHDALKDLNCEYIFSSAKINNPEKSGLQFLKLFTDENSHWDVYLYEVL